MEVTGFPKAILHLDGDSFFASVEQALDYRLRGKPVVTGAERGAATALSYEAKRKGAKRGMTLRQIREVCPDAIVVPSNYTAYSIYAHRMYRIVRTFAPSIEEYSIDECFADLTGLDRHYGMSYEELARKIKAKLESDLGITFGAGLAPNKTLAKVASARHKPAGFTSIPRESVHTFLEGLPMGSIWGVGFSTSLQLERLGVYTALDFAAKDRAWLKAKNISKPYQEIWMELNGDFVKRLGDDGDDAIGSIIKSHTFRPSRDRAYILSQLSANLEAACAKARRHRVKARHCRFYLKTQDFTYQGITLDLTVPLAEPREFLRAILARFDDVYEEGVQYRATGIGLYALTREDAVTSDLFGTSARIEQGAQLLGAIDRLNHKYGRHTVFLGESMDAVTEGGDERTRSLELPVHQRKKTISIPHVGKAH
ncbi:MAG TPA: DNA polymerase IV [Candidatus Paceibacterota bacterium]|jgi:DNA polymerase-4/DNA polymerase V